MSGIEKINPLGTGDYLEQGITPWTSLPKLDNQRIADMVNRELPPIGTGYNGYVKTGLIGNLSLNSSNNSFYIYKKGKEDGKPIEEINTDNKDDASITLNPNETYIITDKANVKAEIKGSQKEIKLNGKKIKINQAQEL